MLREFDTRRPQYDELTQSAEGILSQSGDAPQDPKDLQEVRAELGSISQQWEDLTSRLDLRSGRIDRAQGTSERYQVSSAHGRCWTVAPGDGDVSLSALTKRGINTSGLYLLSLTQLLFILFIWLVFLTPCKDVLGLNPISESTSRQPLARSLTTPTLVPYMNLKMTTNDY